MQDLIDKNMIGDNTIRYDQKHTIVKMKQIDLRTIRMLATAEVCEKAELFLRTNKATILTAKEERVEARLDLNGESFQMVIQRNEERNFDTSCKCKEDAHPICLHKAILFLQLLNAYGSQYFDTIRNWDKEKNKLLGIYGYSMNDLGWDEKFEFTYKDGKPFLRVLDSSVKRVNTVVEEVKPIKKRESVQEEEIVEEIKVEASKRLGIVFKETPGKYPGFAVELVSGEFDAASLKFIGKVEQVDLSKYVASQELSEEDIAMMNAVRKLQKSEIDKYVSRNSPFSGIWENIIYSEDEGLPAETTTLIDEYLYPKLLKLFSENDGRTAFLKLPAGKMFTTAHLTALSVGEGRVKPGLRVELAKKNVDITPVLFVEEWDTELNANEWGSYLLPILNNQLYCWNALEDIEAIGQFVSEKNKHIPADKWPEFLKEKVLPFARKYKVDFDKTILSEVFEGEPQLRLLLQEKNDYLIFTPVFDYHGYEVKYTDKETVYISEGAKIKLIKRNPETESNFIQRITSLHSNFIRTENSFNLVLKGSEVLKNNWYFLICGCNERSQCSHCWF